MPGLTHARAATSRVERGTHLITGAGARVLGVAYRVPVMDSARGGSFLVTAAHALQGASGHDAQLSTDIGSEPIEVVATGDRGHSLDVALLYIERALGPPLYLTEVIGDGAIVVRGAPAGVATRLATLKGRLAGVEELNGRDVLDFVLDDLDALERADDVERVLLGRVQQSVAYAALRGLSGAPVAIRGDDGVDRVCGTLIERNPRGLASRLYAVPTDQLRDFIAAHGVTLQVEHAPLAEPARAGQLLEGALITRMVSGAEREHELWEELSALFYRGVPVDAVLRDMSERPTQYGLRDGLALARIDYLLGRLVLKRGVVGEGVSRLRRVMHQARAESSPGHEQLAALVQLRLFVEVPETRRLLERRSELDRALGGIEEMVDMPAGIRAYEIASAIGKEAVKIAAALSDKRANGEVGSYFASLAARHVRLVGEFPRDLTEKQEVVSIALELLELLWDLRAGISSDERLGELERLTERGRVAARQRENAIFFTQTLIVEAITALASGDATRAYGLALVVGGTLREAGLLLEHEGISSLMLYLGSREPELLEIIEAAYSCGPKLGADVVARRADGARARLIKGVALTAAELVAAEQRLADVFALEPSMLGP